MPKEILEISNVSVKFGDAMILKNISFSVNEKEIVGIIGPNGCGKTTLLNAISGFVPLESGTISYNGQDIMDLPPYKRAQLGIGRSFQHAGIFRDLSVEDNIVIGLEKA